MTVCLNLQCPKSQNPDSARFCLWCGSPLRLGDRYRATDPLSRGGRTDTFAAIDEQTRSRCVIKRFRSQKSTTRGDRPANSTSTTTFRQTIDRLHQLGRHPQLPQLLDRVDLDGESYLVQEFIDGQSLESQLAGDGNFSERQVQQVLVEVLPVLHLLHQAQLIHRNIHPDNLIRRHWDGKLVLVGFGTAKYATPAILANTGTVVGSAEYTAPEQLRGKTTFASDLYSLGATCLHLLSGLSPFDLFDRAEGHWAWRDYLTQPVSDELAALLDRLVAESLNRRYRSVEAVLDDLGMKEISEGMASEFQVQPTPIQPDLPQWECQCVLTNSDEPPSEITTVAFNPKTGHLASGDWQGRVKLWNLDTNQCDRALSGHTSGVMSVAIARDGRSLASGGADGTIQWWQLSPPAPSSQTLVGHASVVTAVAIAPDGKTLISGSRDTTVKLWNLATGEMRQTLAGHAERVTCVALSPRFRVVASGSQDGTIRLWDLDTGECQQTLLGGDGAIYAIAIAPDGETLIGGSWDRTVKLWNLRTGRMASTQCEHTLLVGAIAIHPDGRTFATGSHDCTIKLWQLPNARLIQTLCGHRGGINALVFSPDGQSLASGSQDGTLRLWRSH